MASYQAGFDPPNRPGDVKIERRVGTYWQPSLERQVPRRADAAQLQGQMEPRRGYTVPQPTRLQHTGVPRPMMRSPSPTSQAAMDPKPHATRFGFGRAHSRPPALPRDQETEAKGKSPRNVLRRKTSSVAQKAGTPKPTMERSGSASPSKWHMASPENRPSIEASLKSAEAYSEIFTKARTKTPVPIEAPQIYPELDRYRTIPERHGDAGISDLPPKLSTTDLPPPTPLYSGSSSQYRYSGTYSASGYSASPSTRFSESPGPGAFSRNTTPTSISSQSPGIFAPVKPITPRLLQGSPAQTRPPVTRRRAGSNSNDTEGLVIDPHGLPSLRESLTSSSSNSTVKMEQKTPEPKEKRKKKRLSPPPPSPPPRKSSQKFKKPRSDTEDSPSKVSSTPAKPVMTSPTKSPPVMKPAVLSKPQSKNIPPARPSREGAPDLQPQLIESMAIIQSNLTSLTFSGDRRQSGTLRAAPPTLQLAPRLAQGSRIPSRNPSPSPIQPSPREATPAPPSLGIIPDLKPHIPGQGSGLRTPSPSVSSSKHRFGLFGRRAKTAPEAVPTEKTLRKGPAAGTGHEGYGRYAPRGRSTSAGGMVSGHGRNLSTGSSSMESVSSTRTHDPFLLERMSPVVIAGGEVIENYNTGSELARTESNTSLLRDRPSMESKGSSKPNLGKEVQRDTLWPSALPKEPSRRISTLVVPKGRRPSDSSDDGFAKSSTAFRRSIQRLNSSESSLQLPRPLNVSGAGSSVASLNPSTLSNESDELARGRKTQITKSKKLEKRPRSPTTKRWNIFHRSQSKGEPKAEPPPVTVTVGRPPVKAVPHYALLDNSSDEMADYQQAVDLEELLDDVDLVLLSNEELDKLQFGELKANLKREKEEKMRAAKAQEEKLPPILFSSPEPIRVTPEIPSTDLHLAGDEAPTRPSRLPQVGRIPKVVSARPQATSPKSFSRPFARLSITQPLLEPITLDKESIAVGPSPPKEPAAFPRANLQADFDEALRQHSLESTSNYHAALPSDFFAFSPRKGSEVTTSSSGCVSYSEVTTAVIPEPDAALAEDEIWDEYDDLIETKRRSKEKVPVSATSSHGVPFQYENYESRRARRSTGQSKREQATPKPQQNIIPDSGLPIRASILTSSSVYSTELSPRLKENLAELATPTTPMSFSEFFSGYGDRNNSVHGDSAKKPTHHSPSNSRKSNPESTPTRTQTVPLTISEQAPAPARALAPPPAPAPVPVAASPLSQVNLRLASMTVSKWLTFGHVLFSPAQESIKSEPSKRHSILVIDGLGNDDWSFYAADLYPTATFYNLSPTAPLTSSQQTSAHQAFPHTPPNHRQVQYTSTSAKFPFPSSTFHVVVFRFPPSLPLSGYQNIIAESKRVLVPGGYLEMAILDVDMVSMGPRARRSVRGLKMRLQGDSVWTGSANDTVLKILGKRGFESVKSCVVGVPVAVATPEEQQGKAEEKSLADLIRETSSEKTDEDITMMVAKVGRWWYNRCYEGGITAEGAAAPSMFTDDALVKESEEWKSSFKLLVAHARKPIAGGILMGGKRRTLSV